MASIFWGIASAITTFVEDSVQGEIALHAHLESLSASTEQDPDLPETAIESTGTPPLLEQHASVTPEAVPYSTPPRQTREAMAEDDSDVMAPRLETASVATYVAIESPAPHTQNGKSTRATSTPAPPSETDTGASTGDHRTGLQVLCNSTNVSVGRLKVTNVAGNMVGVGVKEARRIVSAIRAEMRAVITSLPPGVGFSDANSLIITDALGVNVTLPWVLVPTYNDLQNFLVKHFEHKVGERRVQEGRYCIARAAGPDGGRVISRNDWEEVTEQRYTLVMSMLIEQILHEELKQLCPKCGRTELGTYEDNGWQVCRTCNTRFTVTSGTEFSRDQQTERDDDGEDTHFRNVRKAVKVLPGEPVPNVPINKAPVRKPKLEREVDRIVATLKNPESILPPKFQELGSSRYRKQVARELLDATETFRKRWRI